MKSLGVLLAVVGMSLAAVTGVKRLEWTDPQGRKPLTHAAWTKTHAPALGRDRIGCATKVPSSNVVDVVVNAELYSYISAELAQYQADLETSGYSVQIDTMRGTSAPALRTHLAGISNLVGAVFVGELPVAWYETDEEFPIDIYFMDLDGTWGDADADGLYDSHSGNTTPEIWLGRLYARPLTWDDEVRLMRRYLAKDHAYRTGNLSLPDRGLAYVDDDFAGGGSWNLDLVYSDVTLVDDGDTTSASDYRQRLAVGYEWIQLCSHSSPWGHSFKRGTGYSGTVFNTDIYGIRPHAHFYNLYCCSGSRFVEENYSAGWDIFQDDYGLAVVGFASTGGMYPTNDFYTALGQGKTIGEAFKYYLELNTAPCYNGMNLLGDPTLKPHNNARTRDMTETSDVSDRVPSPAREPEIPLTAEVVCTDPETDDSPRLLAMPDGKVWAVWTSGRSTTNGRFDIYASVHSGGSWSSAYNIGADEYWETDPVLGLDANDRPVAVWSLCISSGEVGIYDLVYSTWNGSSWSTPQGITDNPQNDLAADLCRDTTGTLWCCWHSQGDKGADVFSATFDGVSWSTPVNLTDDTFPEYHPACAAMPNGHVWVAYTKYRNGGSEVWARHWDGSTWTETGPVSGSQTRALRPAITNRSDDPLVCWQSFDSGNGDICYSIYNGSTWSGPAAVDSDTALDVHPSLATDPWNSQYLVWMSRRSGNWDIWCSQFMTVWNQPSAVETGTGPDVNPDVVADSSGNVFCAWQNLTAGNWDINVTTWPTTGVSQQQPANVERMVVRPNPASGQVRLVLPRGSACATITDAAGRRVCELCLSGGRELVWNGRDAGGRQVAPGVYMLRVAGSAATKILLVR